MARITFLLALVWLVMLAVAETALLVNALVRSRSPLLGLLVTTITVLALWRVIKVKF